MPTLSPRQLTENRVFPFSQFLLDPSSNIAVCAIQKNGCTTLKRWFLSLAAPAFLEAEKVDVHAQCRIHFAACNLCHRSVIDQRITDAFTLAFARDPLSRLASAFVDKFVGPPPERLFGPAREVIEDLARSRGIEVTHDRSHDIVLPERTVSTPYSSAVDYHRGITFREFVAYLASAPDDHLENHWRSQASYIDGRPFDLIARVESLTDVLTGITSILGRGVVPVKRHSLNGYSEHNDGPYADIPSGELHRRWIRPRPETLCDDALREVVLDRFAADAALYESAAHGLDDRARAALRAKLPLAVPPRHEVAPQ